MPVPAGRIHQEQHHRVRTTLLRLCDEGIHRASLTLNVNFSINHVSRFRNKGE
jgi:hypothetical protein